MSHASTVRAGYDALAPRFGQWTASIEGEPSERFLDELMARLDDGARVLDLGCGDGTNARRLAQSFDAVTAFYSIVHVPRDEHSHLFGKVLRWLKPGGLFPASLSHAGRARSNGKVARRRDVLLGLRGGDEPATHPGGGVRPRRRRGGLDARA